MASLDRRLRKLESQSRKRAEKRLTEHFESLTDMELVLFLTNSDTQQAFSGAQGSLRQNTTEKLDFDEMNRLLKLAAPPGVLASEKAIDSWMRDLIDRCVFQKGRKARLRRCFERVKESDTL